MSLTADQARAAAERHLAELSARGEALRLLPEHTEEHDVGWVFFYQSARYLETGAVGDLLFGNAPLLVTREEGTVVTLGTAHWPDVYLEAYRACGDAHARQVPEIELLGWRPGCLALSGIQAIRAHSELDLTEAKAAIDSAMNRESALVPTADLDTAYTLLRELHRCKFIARVRYESPGKTA